MADRCVRFGLGTRATVPLTCAPEVKAERFRQRHKSLTLEQAQAELARRAAAQWTEDEKAKRADYVIDNGGSVAELRERSDAVLDALCAFFDVPEARYPLR